MIHSTIGATINSDEFNENLQGFYVHSDESINSTEVRMIARNDIPIQLELDATQSIELDGSDRVQAYHYRSAS